MATREENLKKINEELEKLDDEQLEKIAGGVRNLGPWSCSIEMPDKPLNPHSSKLWDKKLWDK